MKKGTKLALDEDEIRGSNPAMSTKDVLMELRTDFKNFRERDFKEMRDNVVVLVAANVPERLTQLEAFKNKVMGLASIGALLGAVSMVISLWVK